MTAEEMKKRLDEIAARTGGRSTPESERQEELRMAIRMRKEK